MGFDINSTNQDKFFSVTIYSDGACSGNPGPGGWGAVILSKSKLRKLSGFEANTTNNRMELTAIIKALELLKSSCLVDIYTDSTYVKDAFTSKWIDKWKVNSWKTAKGDPVKNKDLWLNLLGLYDTHKLNFHWVKGHSGNRWNEECDLLARNAIRNKNGTDELGDIKS